MSQEEDVEIEVMETDIVPSFRREGRLIKGQDCEYIKIASITSNSGCSSGFKFVIKQVTGVRKQFLIMNNEVVGQLQSHLGINYKASHITFCTIKSSFFVPTCLF